MEQKPDKHLRQEDEKKVFLSLEDIDLEEADLAQANDDKMIHPRGNGRRIVREPFKAF